MRIHLWFVLAASAAVFPSAVADGADCEGLQEDPICHVQNVPPSPQICIGQYPAPTVPALARTTGTSPWAGSALGGQWAGDIIAYEGSPGRHTSFVFVGMIYGLDQCPTESSADVVGYWMEACPPICG